ncbi:MAG: MotA/TolQ/ExbB proton channel family protein [Alphaproteobacteria bacterium]|nr:MotA/TolQ/ExbB proton channel family protein [Alphaproteobacteria bacterium]
MSEAAHNAMPGDAANADNSPLPLIKLQPSEKRPDLASILGLIFATGFIAVAILMGKSDASFFNVPSLLIVLFGTMAATAISYTVEELGQAGRLLGKSLFRTTQNHSKMASDLIDLAVVAKKKGPLALSAYESELRNEPFLHRAMQMVIDGYNPDDIDFLLSQELEAGAERHKRAASIARRSSEVAPAMGLIGTLVGLVQMLANLETPETIGPAMALALLTTFYGAILGTVIMAPLAVKLEKRSSDETLIKTMIRITATSMARQENPRKLEMLLNAELSPSERLRYFD